MTDIDRKKKWIFIAAFLDLFAVSLILPSMSAHFKSLGASYFMIGLMNSIYACTQLLSAPILGSWSDKIGRQKIFVISYIIIGCCYPILGVFTSLYIILLLRAIIGIFKHGQTLVRTIVSDQFPKEQQIRFSGQLKSVAAVSFTLGPAIGGHLAELEGGFSYTACCTGILLALNSVIGYLYFADVSIDETNDQRAKEPKKTISAEIFEVVRSLGDVNWLAFGKIFALKFLLTMSAGAFHANYNIKIQERFDITPKYSGYTIAFQSFIGVITALSIERINEKFYKNDITYRRRNCHCYLLMCLSYLGISFTTNLGVFLFWTIILRASHMILRIILNDMLLQKCPSSQVGSVAGVSNSVVNFGRLVTPLTVGIVEDTWGTNSGNVLAAIVSSIGVFISLKIEQNHPKSS